MRSVSSGSLTTLAMFVPLLVVPVLAVLGIPDLDTGRAPAEGADEAFELHFGVDVGEPPRIESAQETQDRPGSFLSSERRQPPDEDWDDPFDGPARNRPAPHESEDESRAGRGADALDEWTRERAPSKPAGRDAESEGTPPPAADSANAATAGQETVDDTGPPSTWQAAVRRLNGLGIQHFHLEPGVHEGEFLFSCTYTPPDNPRITRRFEAEAGDPLRAVQKVIEQVEQWRRQR